MLGDDRHDADAFDALREARASGRTRGLAIAVAGHADVTAAVAPRADLVLPDPMETARLLARIGGRRPCTTPPTFLSTAVICAVPGSRLQPVLT